MLYHYDRMITRVFQGNQSCLLAHDSSPNIISCTNQKQEIIRVIALGLKKFGEERGAKIKENAERREQLSRDSYNLTL